MLFAGGPRVRPACEITGPYIDWIKKAADWQLTQSTWDSSVSWERGALHAGMMAAYEATKDETYLNKSRQWAEKFDWHLASESHHADNNACGQAFMELYFLDQPDPVRYAHFKSVNDSLVSDPTHFYCNAAGGNETWWWCDALFMAPPGMVRLSRALNDPSYMNLMHRMWGETQNCLYDTEEHLFFRDITYFDERYDGKKVFWSRGNGWVLAGTARVLQYLPLTDPNRPRYISLLQEMSAKLITLQQPDGYWYSDLLSPDHYDNPESSGTGFFTFGLAWGINNGFLDEQTYWPAVEAGWEALKAAVQPNGLLGWVQPVGAGPTGTSATTTDVFGVGAYLLAGSEVQKYILEHDPTSIEYFESYLNDAALRQAWADGTGNRSASQVTLGDYGDNFMQLTYRNDQSPYRSQADYTFAALKDFTVDNSRYLSILVRGNAANSGELIYVRLEDMESHTAVQVVTDPNVVQTAAWMELAFPLSGFEGINLNQIHKLSIGVGLPDASSPTGQGTIRVDNIRLFPQRCVGLPEDFSGNCEIDFEDFAILAGQWLDQYAEVLTPMDPGTENLSAHWPLDGDYEDATGNGYDVLTGGSPSFDTGHIGQSVYFDGACYLNCQNSADLTLNQGGTVSAWVRTSGLFFPWASVVTKGLQSWRLVRNNETGAISFHFNSGSTEYQANGSTSILDGQWHHLAGVYDGNEVRLYVDGHLDASASAPNPVNIRSDPVYIGSRVDRPTMRNWTGWIDEVRIYNTALSEANILYLAATEPIIQIPDPRPTDLVLDGIIDINDLSVFILSWFESNLWP